MRGRGVVPFSLCILLLCVSHAAAQTPPPGGALLPGAPPVPPRAVIQPETVDAQAPVDRGQALPGGVLLVPGAAPSSSDRVTPVPEASRIAGGTYHNDYFGLWFRLPENWIQKYDGPPPSDSGAYVLAELIPAERYDVRFKGTITITAQDLFFSLRPAKDPMSVVKDTSERLPSFYRIEQAPSTITIANRPFARLGYMSPAAGLHWSVLTTEVRCHAVQFVFTSRDAGLIASLVKQMDSMKFSESGADAPVCVADYAKGANVTYSVQPVLEDRRFNAIPVRIVIDRSGRVKHVHVISAFADQARIVTEAVSQWRFKPYIRNGEAVEVETGLMFGAPRRARAMSAAARD